MADNAIVRLTRLMERLRGPGGCPWDLEQSLESLTPFIIEEAYEVVSAIETGGDESIKEELGDLLFQIIFACRITTERGAFGLDEVIDSTVEKMVRRHPHVFGDTRADTSKEVLKHWAEIKEEEKKGSPEEGEEGHLSGVPKAMPALLRAHKISQKASKAGFDWKDVDHVLEKVSEEVSEFAQAVRARNATDMEEELGDILFTLVNVARFLEVNPEEALRKTIGKFMQRFHKVERALEEKGGDLGSTPAEELERLWNEAKG
jgi:tetrapyrrole methylase family protein/MazG family protein